MKKCNKLFLILFGICLLIVGLIFLLINYLAVPKIVLYGNKAVSLEFSTKYKEEGYSANFFGKDYTNKVKIKDNINYDKLGEYTIEYSTKNKIGTKHEIKSRNIKIIDTTKPVIELNGSDIVLDLNEKYNELGYKAIDNYDGDISGNVKIESDLDINKEGSYKIIYTVLDSSGNKAVVERNVIVTLKNVTSVPILTYHNFMSAEEKKQYYPYDNLVLPVSQFENQLKYLKENGYNTISLDKFYKWYKGEIILTKKDVVIVIDDGNISSYIYAIPLLEKYGFQATIFVITDRIKKQEQTWDPSKSRFFDEYKINDVRANHKNIDLQSHTHSLHQLFDGKPIITVKTKEEIENDFKISKEILNAEYLAFPFGANSQFTGEVLSKLGYKMAFAFGANGYGRATKNDDQYYIKRVNITSETTQRDFINWLEVR